MKPGTTSQLRLSRYEWLASILLIVLGLTIIVVPTQYWSDHQTLVQSCTNIGAGLITIGALFLYYSVLFLDPASKLKEIVEKTPTLLRSCITIGIDELFLNREEVPKETWMTLVRSANSELSITGVALQQFVAQADFPKLIKERCRAGVVCRIILIHPESDDVRQRESMDNPQSYGPVGRFIVQSLERLKLTLLGLQIVRLHKLAHTCDIVWADNTMYVSQYLAGGPGGTSPCIKVGRKQSGVFDRYVEHFEALWEDKETVTLEDYFGGKTDLSAQTTR